MKTITDKCFQKIANTFKKVIKMFTDDFENSYDDSDYSAEEHINNKYWKNLFLKSNFDKCWLRWLQIKVTFKIRLTNKSLNTLIK